MEVSNGISIPPVTLISNPTTSTTENPTPAQETSRIANGKELKKAENQGQHVSISDEQLIKAIDRAVKAMQGASTSLSFSIHEKTKQILVKVIDNDTGQIIREVPPEKHMDFLAKIWEMAGLLIDEKR